MGNVALTAVQRAAITKFAGATMIPSTEIQATVFDPLGQLNWRDIDFTGRDCRDTFETLTAHSAETHHIPQLFGYVARLLDGISASATSGALLKSSSSSSHNSTGSASPGQQRASGNNNVQTATTTTSTKEHAQQLKRTTNLTRLAGILLFNVIQQCAGNPFTLLRLTNSPNEEAMTMLGAAAELIVRVPFSTATAELHVEATELLRFSFATRLYGTGLTAAAREGMSVSVSAGSSAAAAAAAASVASANGSASTPVTNIGHGASNNNSASGGENETIVRDPFLRRLALGQRDALLTKALVHALLQRICVWASVLRGMTRPTVWVAHQKATNAAASAVVTDPAPSIVPTGANSSNAPSPQQASARAALANNNNSGWGTKLYGLIFGSGNQNKNASSSSNNNASPSSPFAPSSQSSSVPYPTAGLSSTQSSAETIVGSASLHVLLCLLFFERGSTSTASGKTRNTAVEVIRQLRGLDIEHGGFGIESTTSDKSQQRHQQQQQREYHFGSTMISPILGGDWPLELVEALATLIPSHLEAVILLYCLLNDCQSFTRCLNTATVTSSSSSASASSGSHTNLHVQLAHTMVDLLRPAIERPSSPESLFSAVVVAILARVDGIARTMFTERLRSIPAYFVNESPYVTTSLTVGAFVALAITKVVFRASMADGQAAIGAAWLSALVNLSPFIVGLETAVEQKIASLFLALLRRVHRLRNEVRANEGGAFHAHAQLDTAYEHLDIAATAVFQMVADPQRNPTLLYELLYHREKISQVTSSWTEGDPVWRALKPITFILDRIEAEMSSLSEKPRSIPGILAVIRSVGRSFPSTTATTTSPVVVAPDGSTSEATTIASGESSRVRVTLHEAGAAAGVLFPKISFLGQDEEVTLSSYEFTEEQRQDEFDDRNDDGDADNGERQQHQGGNSGICEPFFATLLWHCILHTDSRVEPPGCLRHGALGVSHGEVLPVFRHK